MQWFNTTTCHQFYEELGMLDRMNHEFEEGDNWLCPDVQNITLIKDVFVIQRDNSQSFGMVVNSCSTAKRIDQENGLVPPSDVDCDTEKEAELDQM